VWVLDSGIWLGAVDLPGGAVVGLSDSELVEPAAFEAEALSEITPAEAVTAVQRRRMVDAEDTFLVAQARRSEVSAVAKAVRGARARLVGIGHPAGLPEALAEDPVSGAGRDGSWRRLEFWSDSVVFVEAVAGPVTLIPLGAVPQSDWRRALTPHLRDAEPVIEEQTLIEAEVQVRGGHQWQEKTPFTPLDSGAARWLAANEGGDDEVVDTSAWKLEDDAAATNFAAAWVRRLAGEDAARPEIGPILRPPSAQTDRWPAVAVGVLAFALALSAVLFQRSQGEKQATVLQAQLDYAQGEQQVVTDRRQQLRTIKAQVTRKERAVESLEQELDRLGRDPRNAAAADRRVALAALMEAVGQLVYGDVVIRSIEYRLPRQYLVGVAATPEAASRLASDLSRTLSAHWRVSPAQIEPQTGTADVVWEFTILLDPPAEKRVSALNAQR
ncbi:MAG: hypothetical protein AAF552_14825, partial [Pseudomonadota bacterium]